MQSIEVVIFFVFAVLVGFIMIGFITGFDFISMQEQLYHLMGGPGQKIEKLETVEYSSFLEKASDCWKRCNFGTEDRNCGLIHIVVNNEKDFGKTLSKTAIDADFRKFHICEDCNVTLIPANIAIPASVELKCNKTTGKLEIWG